MLPILSFNAKKFQNSSTQRKKIHLNEHGASNPPKVLQNKYVLAWY